ncbi:MAG: domain fusion protein YloV [Firmicutes bacterium]|nr:domain fusion protein YloV [Bacillota bacterium]
MPEDKERITGEDYRRMIAGAYQSFLQEYEYINSLNVFPVPDGDTGTNMLLTLDAVSKEVSCAPETSIGTLSKRAADSAIMGARGNSGVILSQLFRGIARGLAGKKEATTAELAKAFRYGVLYAYRAVAKPMEGTILTVAKGIAKGAYMAVRDGSSFKEILSASIQTGQVELARTPELLPVLKEAGVVDAGGQGLIVFFQGCLKGLEENEIETEIMDVRPQFEMVQPEAFGLNEGMTEQVHPYCTEFIVKRCRVSAKAAQKKLLPLGESIVLAADNALLKVHIHTANPGAVLGAAIQWGSLHDIKVDNMQDQHRTLHQPSPRKAGLAVISVAAGKGITDMMVKLGAEVVISGGQTMNPPVEEFVTAVQTGNAKQYIILPNNKNIVLAAAQAKKILGDKVAVLPTLTIPQGFAALLGFNAGHSLPENLTSMQQRLLQVRSGSVTNAVRDSVLDGHTIAAGAFIGFCENQLAATGQELGTVLVETIRQLIEADSEIISLYYGQQVSADEAKTMSAFLIDRFPDLGVELYYGGQPNYQWIISVE